MADPGFGTYKVNGGAFIVLKAHKQSNPARLTNTMLVDAGYRHIYVRPRSSARA